MTEFKCFFGRFLYLNVENRVPNLLENLLKLSTFLKKKKKKGNVVNTSCRVSGRSFKKVNGGVG